MSQTIDNRIVQLEFDNADFEKGVGESLSTLQKLKSNLNLDGASRSLSNLGAAARNFNLDGISNAVDQVGEKFSYMKYAGLVAIENLVTGAMNAGSRIVSALTGPIMSGGWNRAMNLEQANFMLEGLLKDADKVQAVMDDVSKSVDGTAYSLDAAAKVAAQLSASGIQAGDGMLSSLQAIAGTAAMTNSTFEDIGSIFTTVAGQGKLMAYQMNQLSFRGLNVAATLGEQMGKTEAEIRDMVSKGKISFQMFSDAMNEAFGEHATKANETFSGALSNVKSALGRIGAEFATPFIKNIIPVLNSFRLAINATKATLTPFFETASSGMEVMSKRIVAIFDRYTEFVNKHGSSIKGVFSDLIGAAKNLLNFATSITGAIHKAFNETFTGKTLAGIRKMTVSIFQFTQKLKLTEDQSSKLSHIFAGFFSIFSTFGTIIRRVAIQINDFLPYLRRLASIIGDALSKVSDFLLTINNKVVNSDFLTGHVFTDLGDKISSMFDGIGDIGSKITGTFDKVKTAITDLFQKNLVDPQGFKDNILSIRDFFARMFDGLVNGIKKIIDSISRLAGNLGDVGGALVRVVETFLSRLLDSIATFLHSETLKDLEDLAKSSLFIMILNEIKNFIKRFKTVSSIGSNNSLFKFSFFNSEAINGALNSLKQIPGILSKFEKDMVNIELLKNLGKCLLQIAAALFVLSAIDSAALGRSVAAISAVMAELVGAVTLIQKTTFADPDKLKVFQSSTDLVFTLAKAILVLTASLFILSTIEPKRLVSAIVGVGAMMAGIIIAMKQFEGFIEKMIRISGSFGKRIKPASKLIKSFGKVMIQFALSILVLAGALKLLSTIPFENLMDSLIALTVILGETLGFFALYQKMNISSDNSKALAKIGASLLVLALALKIMSTIDADAMGVALKGLSIGLLSIVGALAILGLVAKAMKKGLPNNTVISFNNIAQSLLLVSLALIPLSLALKIMSTIDLKSMGTALLGLVVGLAAMATSLGGLATAMEDAEISAGKVAGMAAAMLLLSMSLIPMATSIFILSKAMAKGNWVTTLIAFGVGLAGMVLALEELESLNPGKLIVAAAAMVIFSAALIPLGISIAMIGKTFQKSESWFGIIFSFVAAMWTLTLCLEELEALNPGKLILGALALDMVAVAVVGLSAALRVLATIGPGVLILTILDLAAALIVLGIAIALIGGAWEVTLPGAAILLGLLAGLVGVVALFGLALNPVAKGLAAIGGALLILNPALQDVFTTFKSFGVSLGKVIGAMFAFSAALLGVGIILTKAAPFLLVASIGLAALVGVVALFGLALNPVAKGLAAIGGALVVFETGIAGILEVLTKFDIGLGKIIGSAFALAATLRGVSLILAVTTPLMLVAAVGVGALVLVLKGLGPALQEFAVGLDQMLTVITKYNISLGKFVGAMFALSAAIFGVSIILAVATPFLAVFANSLVVLGVAIAAIGAGAFLLGKGIESIVGAIALFATIGDAVSQAAEQVTQFLTIIGDYIRERIASFITWFSELDLSAVFNNIIDGILDAIQNLFNKIDSIDWETGINKIYIILSMVLEKIEALLEQFIDWLIDRVPDWVARLIIAIMEGLQKVWDKIKEYVSSRWDEFKEDMGKWKDELKEKARYIIEGFLEGLNEKWDEIKAFPGKVRDKILGGIEGFFDIASPSKKMYWEGLMIALGLNEGLDEGSEGIEGTVDKINNVIEGGVGGIVDGLKEKVTSFFSLDITKANKEIEGSIADCTTQLSKGQMTMEEWNDTAGKQWDRIHELCDELNRIQGEYDAGRMSTEEYEAASANLEQEVYTLIGSSDDLKTALSQLDSQIALEESQQRKYSDAMREGGANASYFNSKLIESQNTVFKLKEIKHNLTGKTQESTDATKKETDALDKNTAATTTNSKSKSAASKTEKDFAESLTSTLQGQMKIFSKFEAKQAMSKQTLLENMKSQIQGMTNWAASMNKLSEKGIDQALYKKLAEMGVNGAEYVAAFNEMTAEELAQANEMWAESLVLPGSVAKSINADMKNIGENTLVGFQNGLDAQTNNTLTQLGVIANDGVDTFAEGVGTHSPSWKFFDMGVNCLVGLIKGLDSYKYQVYWKMAEIGNMVVEVAERTMSPDKFETIGMNAVQGFINGMNSKMDDVNAMATELASIAETVMGLLGEQSPSKVFYQIGRYVDEGMANGMHDYSGRVFNEAEDMANGTIESMRFTIANIASMLNDEMQDPVIKPILDLSNVQAGVRTLNGIFGNNQALIANPNANLQNGQYSANGNVVFNQYNTSPKALSRYEIYRDTRNMLNSFRQANA